MRVVSARNGWKWLWSGWELFRKSPVMWLFLVFTYWMIVALLGQVRYVGLAVSTLLLPAFSVSFMATCAVLEQGRALQPALLFSGFFRERSRLIGLGAAYLTSIVGVLGVASIADAGALLRWVLAAQEPSIDALRDGSVSRALLLAAAVGTPVLMAFWFAPVLAAWGRLGGAQSLFYSFFAVLRNWRAFCVYGAALALAGVIFLSALTFAALAIGQLHALRVFALLATLFSLPILFASFYASYRDIFPENEVPADLVPTR